MRAHLRATAGSVRCTCDVLPSGPGGVQVKAGHQVEYLKAWLKEQPDVGERGVRLLHEGREMIDPLSFMDYPDIAGAGACTVTVELL